MGPKVISEVQNLLLWEDKVISFISSFNFNSFVTDVTIEEEK